MRENTKSINNILKDNKLDNSILIGYRGSIAHEMYVPSKAPDSIDDKDIMTVIIPDKSCYFGLSNFGSRGTKEMFINEWDIVCYELLKYISLLKKCNPNVLSLLWLKDSYYIKKTKIGKMLIDNRDLFVSKQAYHSFIGYAYSQLHRMTHMKFEGYMGEKRKRLVEKFGYDTKNAAHLIRILRMGIEFVNEGILYVARKDSAQLLEIKKGEWALEQVKKEADYLFKRIENCYDNCKLADNCDNDKINELCINILEEYFYDNR